MRSFRSANLIAPLFVSLLVHGSACTTEVEGKNKNKTSSESPSDAAAASDASQPGSGPGTNPESNPSSSQPDTEPSTSQGSGSTSSTSSSSTSQEPGEEPDTGECQDGEVDNNCHALADGTPIEFPTGVPLGNCKAGTRVCQGNQWGPCEGAIAPQAKDNCEVPNDDASCDGVANAGCDCVTGQTRECGESNIGTCKLGTQRCVNGQWDEACEGAVYPSSESCDGKGLDEDCNGASDLADEACDCIDDTTESCQRDKQKGDCKWGQRSCKEGAWGKCVQWAKSEPEVCGARPDVDGVVWTGDEDCDGKIDASPFGKPGPKGCIKMMLDKDGDGYGKIGDDLSKLKSESELDRLATACLCPGRPDIAEKRKEGWTEETQKANRDCGDCAAPLDGEGREAFPGSPATTTRVNRCLRKNRWQVGRPGSRRPGYFDLNCDRNHDDPANKGGDLTELVCRQSGDFSCTEVGRGRLILPVGEPRINCGQRYDFGRCYAIVEESYQASHRARQDDSSPDDSSTQEPQKKFIGCGFRRTGGSHLIRCQ